MVIIKRIKKQENDKNDKNYKKKSVTLQLLIKKC